jgi:hypothetical protein
VERQASLSLPSPPLPYTDTDLRGSGGGSGGSVAGVAAAAAWWQRGVVTVARLAAHSRYTTASGVATWRRHGCEAGRKQPLHAQPLRALRGTTAGQFVRPGCFVGARGRSSRVTPPSPALSSYVALARPLLRISLVLQPEAVLKAAGG